MTLVSLDKMVFPEPPVPRVCREKEVPTDRKEAPVCLVFQELKVVKVPWALKDHQESKDLTVTLVNLVSMEKTESRATTVLRE